MSLPLRWEETILEMTPPATPQRPCRPSRGKALARGMALLTCLFTISLLSVIGAASVIHSLRPPASLQLIPGSSAGATLGLATPAIVRKLGYVTVTGNVVNRQHTALKHVEAVVELLDGQNRTLQVESGLLAFDPLRPGETSPFQVELADDLHAVSYRVRFKELSGQSLN